MKIKLLASAVIFTLITTANGTAFAQVPSDAYTRRGLSLDIAQTTSSQETEKINNIKKLIEITGEESLFQHTITESLTVFKSEYPQVPSKFWDAFIVEIKQLNLANELITIYGKYFTNEDIKQMLAFYQTPIGKKILSTLPEISRESTAVGIRYGRQVVQRVMEKLEAEGYVRPPK